MEDINMNRYIYILVVLIFFLGIVTACLSTDSINEEGASSGDSVVVKHELGETTVPKNPEKVLVFDFGMLDTLNYLNVDVLGVPQQNIPEYLSEYEDSKYENIGSLKEPDFEKIANISPDLIIFYCRQLDQYDKLKKLEPVINID